MDYRGRFHQHFYLKVLGVQIPKAEKDSREISVFLPFWDLCTQKLLLKCLWNWLQVSIAATFFVRTSFFYIHVTRKSCLNAIFVQKFVRLTLMKLTTGCQNTCLVGCHEARGEWLAFLSKIWFNSKRFNL